jgi:sec-independent protein translocase protein TatA
MFGSVGMPELIIGLVVILLLFGAKRVPELARGLGSGVREFKKGTKEGEVEDKKEEEKTDEEQLEASKKSENDDEARLEEDSSVEAEKAEQQRS